MKRWRLVVTHLGGSKPLAEVTVEAPNWMGALTRARGQLGEEEVVPRGASCAVAPDGSVTVLDPVARKTYVLALDTQQSFVREEPKGPRIPAEEAPQMAAPQAAERKFRKTMAYVPAELAKVASGTRPQAAAATPSPEARVATPAPVPMAPVSAGRSSVSAASSVGLEPAAPSSRASASSATSQGHSAVSTEGRVSLPSEADAIPLVAPRTKRASAPPKGRSSAASPASGNAATRPGRASAAPSAAGRTSSAAPAGRVSSPSNPGFAPQVPPRTGGSPLTLMDSRSEEPSEESPLHYRERTYAAPAGTTTEMAETYVRAELEALKAELGEVTGRFFNLAVFDHVFEERPQRPPLVVLRWKDWRGEPEIERPLARRSTRPRVPTPPPAREENTDEHDARLAKAFEATQDLMFLATPAEAIDFVIRLLDELVPCEASSGSVYDIDADKLRCVVATGPHADELKAHSIVAAGLLAIAMKSEGAIFAEASDPRFDASVDGRQGVETTRVMYMPLSKERLLGMIQLVNPRSSKGFTTADVSLLNYVGKQLSDFLFGAKMR